MNGEKKNRCCIPPPISNCHLYHYAGNNPVRYTDPDGRDVINTSNHIVIVKPEHDENCYVILFPGQTYIGEQDGILFPNGRTIKCFGLITVTVFEKDGELNVSGTKLSSVGGNVLKGVQNIINAIRKKDLKDYYSDHYLYYGEKSKEFLKSWWERCPPVRYNNEEDIADETKKQSLLPADTPDGLLDPLKVEEHWKTMRNKSENEQ